MLMVRQSKNIVLEIVNKRPKIDCRPSKSIELIQRLLFVYTFSLLVASCEPVDKSIECVWLLHVRDGHVVCYKTLQFRRESVFDRADDLVLRRMRLYVCHKFTD